MEIERLLVDTNSIWYDFLLYRYGNLTEAVMGRGAVTAGTKKSI